MKRIARFIPKAIRRTLAGLIWLALDFFLWIPVQWIRISALRLLWRMEIGEKTIIYRKCEIRTPRNVKLGRNTSIGHECKLDGRGGLSIGSSVNLSTGVWIWTQEHEVQSPDFRVISGRVVIEDYAWLGSRVIILPGLTIGKGAVVASGAVVTKSIPPYAIVAGVPARRIGTRSEDLQYQLSSCMPFI